MSLSHARSVSRRTTVYAQAEHQVHICTGKVCKKQGSPEVVRFGRDLGLQDVTVHEAGCLGRCGTGPNGLVLPEQTPVRGVATVADLTAVLEHFCGVTVHPALVQATKERQAGNACARDGQVQDAVQHYTKGLELLQEAGCTAGQHLLYSNRSIAELTAGHHEAALADAMAAVAAAPEGWHTAWVRVIDAYFAMGRFADAAATLKSAVQVSTSFKSTDEFKIISSALRSRGVKLAI